ncbi:hypothetical protein C41B8_10755 [Salinisphaera hydrothermalis C41B8]|uniref:Uncharacterized protein n=1 Tax=Salinisphaera hydrothermalis (strain C41B8) TaxID=1304275 RepID=A0A084IKV1_SALHC|nr:hypothetical protein C41B8_10755 [Salinisphaera hydrothermalis C41B8]
MFGETIDIGEIAEIQRHGLDLGVRVILADFVGHALRSRQIARGDYDVIATGGQRGRHLPADAAVAAGDQYIARHVEARAADVIFDYQTYVSAA